ncbi:MAG: hypothetical protein OXF74_10420 [Rhodobacteraceae bacterium]|nr:hypothetical protein [Paracoccaceae bacterium]
MARSGRRRIGYDAGNRVRYELLFEYRPKFEFAGEANFLAPGRRQSTVVTLSSVSAMAAGFFDFDRMGPSGSYWPFIGGGVGVAHNSVGSKSISFPTTMTIAPGGNHTGLAWMVSAGMAFELDEKT